MELLLLLLACLFAVGAIVLAYFDINSTMMVLKRKAGVEANPLFLWLQKVAPDWVWKLVRMAFAFYSVYSILTGLPLQWAVLALFVACAFWGWVVNHNYGIANAKTG